VKKEPARRANRFYTDAHHVATHRRFGIKEMNARYRNTPEGCLAELQRFIAVPMQKTVKTFGSLESLLPLERNMTRGINLCYLGVTYSQAWGNY
jgi:hypothetical protein